MDLTGLGRRYSPDERDRKYLLPKRPRAAAGIVRRHWASPGILDQGSTSQCVIYAADKYLTSRPITNKGFLSARERTRIYKEVQRLDEWEGEDYDGTSVRAVFAWLKSKGFVSEYRWSFECEPVVSHVLAHGPVEMGTSWDENMSNPDRWGYITIDKNEADDAGHAWTIIGADREKVHPRTKEVGAVRMINSWGSSWGNQKGRAWVSFATLDRLIKMNGEAAVASEIKVANLDLTTAVA